jgi:tetratricopeptide (TPR) repeat protein
MRLYKRSKSIDLTDTISQSFFDADHGYVNVALDRLADLAAELGQDPHICYAEGIIRRDFIGQGEAAYNCFEAALSLDGRYDLAAANAATLAPSESSYRKWAALALELAPTDRGKWELLSVWLDKSRNYSQFMVERAVLDSGQSHFGTAAAYLEIALSLPLFDENEFVDHRRLRAQALRALDEKSGIARSQVDHFIPPEERLSLHEALAELDCAIQVDPADAELWNLRSAWCILLGRYEEAVEAADRAIELRPSQYAKPFHNKARALFEKGDASGALVCAKRAQKEAEAAASVSDVDNAKTLLAEIQSGKEFLGRDGLMQVLRQVGEAMERRAVVYAGTLRSNLEQLYRAFFAGVMIIKPRLSLDHVSAIALLIANCPADASAAVLLRVRGGASGHWTSLVEATCYVVAKGEAVMARDAARVLALLIISEPDLETVVQSYRRYVAAPSIVGTGFAMLKSRVESAMHTLIGTNDAETTPFCVPSREELDEARQGILTRLSGQPFINDSSSFPQRRAGGCLGTLLTIAGVVASSAVQWCSVRRVGP